MYLPLDRGKSRMLAIALIVAGWILLPDILTFGTTPGADLLNMMIAGVVSDLTGMTYHGALMTSFGLAFVLIGAGFLVYPYNTQSLIRGKINTVITFMMANPLFAIAGLVSIFVLWFFGAMIYDMIKEYALTLI